MFAFDEGCIRIDNQRKKLGGTFFQNIMQVKK